MLVQGLLDLGVLEFLYLVIFMQVAVEEAAGLMLYRDLEDLEVEEMEPHRQQLGRRVQMDLVAAVEQQEVLLEQEQLLLEEKVVQE